MACMTRLLLTLVGRYVMEADGKDKRSARLDALLVRNHAAFAAFACRKALVSSLSFLCMANLARNAARAGVEGTPGRVWQTCLGNKRHVV